MCHAAQENIANRAQSQQFSLGRDAGQEFWVCGQAAAVVDTLDFEGLEGAADVGWRSFLAGVSG